jgi:E3 ubiquitin-protein ligase RBBP6
LGKARTTVLPQAQASTNDDDGGIPADLHCKICKEVMADAVMTSKCCFSSFCDRCIRAHIVANSKCACGARTRTDDLIPNPTLRTTISNILATRAGGAASCTSGTTEKQRSSVGSNVVPETQTQSPAASRHSLVSSKSSEHSDGSESTSSRPAVAHEPRTEEQETTDTTGAPAANHADHHYGGYYGVPPFPPACYNPFFNPWSADPSMYYGYGGMPQTYPYDGGYPVGPHHVDAMGASYGYHGERHDGRKRTGCDNQNRGFKRRCSGSRSEPALVLT